MPNFPPFYRDLYKGKSDQKIENLGKAYNCTILYSIWRGSFIYKSRNDNFYLQRATLLPRENGRERHAKNPNDGKAQEAGT